MKFKMLFILLLSAMPAVTQAQQIQGKVFGQNAVEGEYPLPGVNIYWAGTTHGAVSDINGGFSIRKMGKAENRLVFSFIGYANDTLTVEPGQNNLKVILKEPVTLAGITVSERAQSTSVSRVDPIQTQLIGSCELKKAACCNLSESFETNASVDVNYTDALTGAKMIQLLGLSGTYVQLMQENMPDYQGIHSPYALTFIPGPWLESIQISKGSASVVGGYQSITGQINTELKKPDQKEWLFLNLFGSSSGRMEFNGNVSHRLNDEVSTMVLAHAAYNDIPIDHNDDGFMEMPLTKRYHLMNRWRYYRGNLMLQAGIGYLEEERMGGQDNVFFGDAKPAKLYTTYTGADRFNAFFKSGLTFPGNGNHSLALLSNYSLNSMEIGSGNNSYIGNQASFNARLVYRVYSTNEIHDLQLGISEYYDLFDESYNDSLFGRTENVPGLFAEYTVKPHKDLTVVGGLRYDLHNMYGGFFTPRLHLRYAPSEKWVVRASAGTGRRSPNLYIDNSGIISTTYNIWVKETPLMERALTTGISGTYYGSIMKRDLSVSLDFYHTSFMNQLIIDQETYIHTIMVSNLNGQSYSNNVQLEVHYEPVKRLQVVAAARYSDVKQTLGGELLDKPYVKRFKALLNASYLTSLQKWQFDGTLQVNGKSRLPDPVPCPLIPELESESPVYAVLNLQVTKNFRRWSAYLGVENLTGYMQHHPLVGYNDPFGDFFDASRIWGPLDGRKFYFGVRMSLDTRSVQ